MERNTISEELGLDVLGKLVRKVRMQKKLTQEELAKLVGVSRSQISLIENNLENDLSIQLVMKIFGAMKVRVNFSVVG
ncbi:MAG: helix-turn-helix transcriptional regulator [Saprospiraceae bacterium]|nr:helix-turn-helix transcriptional regulator [Saprospiraceae bacterium]